MSNILIEYIQEQLLANQADVMLSPDDDLLGSGLVDSLGMTKLIMFIEKKFELRIPPEDMTIEHFMTVQNIQDYLEKRKADS
ncbi:MAG: acyl carrier protein [Bacteroidota bacterium]